MSAEETKTATMSVRNRKRSSGDYPSSYDDFAAERIR